MWRYVSRRVQDTIELGINVRKSFTVGSALNHHPRQQQQPERNQNNENFYNVVPRHQDPSSRDKERRDEKFKKKYYRLHQDKKCFLSALTWSTALITGFYASQLLCLYRRNQRLGFDASRCFYSKYVLSTSHAVHRNVQQYLLTPEGQRQPPTPKTSRFGCPFKNAKRNAVVAQSRQQQQQSLADSDFKDFKNFADPGYKQYERFFEAPKSFANDGVYNVNHKPKAGASKSAPAPEQEPEKTLSAEEKEDQAIDSAIRQLAQIVGELEYQLGVDSMMVGNIGDAIDHFVMSTNQNHPGGIFNLALCYEQGLGVKKNMKTARKLYEMASELGHAKASYNLAVFHAQGLGGFQKSRLEAKKNFELAAALGSSDAIEALRLLLPVHKKLPAIEEFPNEEFYFKEKMMIPNTVSAISNNLRRIAV